MMKIRDRLFQKFKSTKSTADLKAFKQFRNRVVNELRESKKNYYHQFFEENKNNMKMLWNGIKNIVSLKSNNLDTIPISCIKKAPKSMIQERWQMDLTTSSQMLQMMSQRLSQESLNLHYHT